MTLLQLFHSFATKKIHVLVPLLEENKAGLLINAALARFCFTDIDNRIWNACTIQTWPNQLDCRFEQLPLYSRSRPRHKLDFHGFRFPFWLHAFLYFLGTGAWFIQQTGNHITKFLAIGRC